MNTDEKNQIADISTLKTDMKHVHNTLEKVGDNIEKILEYNRNNNGKVNRSMQWIESFEKEGYKDSIKKNSTSRIKIITAVTVLFGLFSTGGYFIVSAVANTYFDEKLEEFNIENNEKIVDRVVEEMSDFNIKINFDEKKLLEVLNR